MNAGEETILCWQKFNNHPTIVKHLDNCCGRPWSNVLPLIVASSSSRVRKITLRLPKTFSPVILVRSTRGYSFAFAASVPFHLGCCLLLPFEVRFETKGKWLLFCCFTQNYTARERVSTPRFPFRLLDLASNFHLWPVRDTCALLTNKDWLTVMSI